MTGSAVLGDLFSTAAMRAVFSDENRVQRYLDVEAALARAESRLGIIPDEAAAEIARNCSVDRIDVERLRERTVRVGAPVLGVVEQLTELCAGGLGQYCHWGATTQDVTDTATVLQIREALSLVDADLEAIAGSLAGLVRRHRDTPMAGRSMLQQAVPVTLGYKLAVILSAIERHRDRLIEVRPRILTGQLGGAAGTLASLGGRGLEVQAELVRELGLGQPDITWHTSRDRIAEVGCLLALVTGTLAKLAADVALMMQTEIGEVSEPPLEGRGSSSTMPQKRNPVSSTLIQACAPIVRQHAATLLEAMVAEHERSTGPWQTEWIALPEVFLLTSGALAHARSIVDGLQIDAARMRANLDLTGGLIVSEAVMMGLAPHLGRERAHELVARLSRSALEQRRPLLDVLAEAPEVTRHLDRDRLAQLCDPAHYLGLSGVMADRVLAAHRRTGR